MLRYLSYGVTDYRSNVVGVARRVNWEFVVAVRGDVAPVLAGGPPVPSRTRRLWLFPPATPHGWTSAGPVVRACFHFGFVPPPLDGIVPARGYHETPLTRAAARRVLALARNLQPHWERPTGASLLHFHAALLELSLLALASVPAAALPRAGDLAEQRVDAALAWYAEHLAERPTLAQVARVAHASPSHFRRLVRKIRGTTPHRAVQDARLRRAMELMSNAPDKLAVIAEQTGFGSPADFARAFRSRYRTSPSAWRRGRLIPEDDGPPRAGDGAGQPGRGAR